MADERILIVEDDPIIGMDLQETVGKMGWKVCGCFESGEEAVARAAGLRPDLILMDVRLSGDIDGIDAAGEILKTVFVPVIFLTAHADEELFHRARKVGPHSYLLKPVREFELRNAVQLALEYSLLRKDLKLARDSFENLVENHLHAMLVVDADGGRVIYANPAAAELFGARREDLAGETFGLPTEQDNTRRRLNSSGQTESRALRNLAGGKPFGRALRPAWSSWMTSRSASGQSGYCRKPTPNWGGPRPGPARWPLRPRWPPSPRASSWPT